MRDVADDIAPDPEADPDGEWVLEPGADETERVLDALGSASTRELFWRLYEAPATASDLAEHADCSVQNAHYHLEKLESAGLVEVVDDRYSEKGNPMDIYAPTADPVVLAGDGGRASRLRDLLDRTFAVALAAACLLGVVGLGPGGQVDPAPPTGPASLPAAGGPEPLVVAAAVAAVIALVTGGARLALAARER